MVNPTPRTITMNTLNPQKKLMNKFLMENTTIDDDAEDIDNNYNEILNNNNNGESDIKGVSPLYIDQQQ